MTIVMIPVEPDKMHFPSAFLFVELEPNGFEPNGFATHEQMTASERLKSLMFTSRWLLA
jgi:hypothetical protein